MSFKSGNIKDRVEQIKQYFIGGYNIVLCGKPTTNLLYNSLGFEHTIKEIEIKESFILKDHQVLFVSLFDLFNKSIKKGKWELNKKGKDVSFNLTNISELKDRLQ